MNRRRLLVLIFLTFPLIACFEDPVREHLHITLSGPGPLIVTVIQEVADPDLAKNNPALADRMEESRSTLEKDLDPWSRRFDLLEPLAEHQSVEHVEGRLRRVVHSAVLSSFEDMVRMIEADGLTGNLAAASGEAELSLFPTGGSRATYSQRQQAEQRLAEWSASLARYFGDAIALYEHLDLNPDRAIPCFAHVFDTHEGLAESGPLFEEEEHLVVHLKESLDLVVEALMVPEDESFSLNELARLVYDPFPARLTVAVQGLVLETEGWQMAGGIYERPAVDAWNALRSLEGRWIEPDLVTALAAPASEDEQPEADPLDFAARPRHFSMPPTSGEVESAVLNHLVPEDVLRLRWRTPPDREEGEPFDSVFWLPAMAEAEKTVLD